MVTPNFPPSKLRRSPLDKRLAFYLCWHQYRTPCKSFLGDCKHLLVMNMFACKHTSQRGPASVSGPHTAAHRGRFDSDQVRAGHA